MNALLLLSIEPKLQLKIDGEENRVCCYTLSDNGDKLYIQYKIRKGANESLNIYIWDIHNQKLLDSIESKVEFCGMVISNDEKILVCASLVSNGTYVFDTENKSALRADFAETENPFFPGIFQITKIAGTNYYAVIEYSVSKIQIFDFTSGKKIKDIFSPLDSPARNIKLADDFRFALFYYEEDKSAVVMSLLDDTVYPKFTVSDLPSNVSFGENHPIAVINYRATNELSKLQVFNFEKGELVREIDGINDITYSIFTNNDENIYTGFNSYKYLQLNHLQLDKMEVFQGNFNGNLLKKYKDDSHICIADMQGNFFIFDPEIRDTLFRINQTPLNNLSNYYASNSTPDGKYIFVSDFNSGLVMIYDLKTGAKVWQFMDSEEITKILFSADSQTMLTKSISSKFKLWDIRNINDLKLLKSFSIDSATNCSFSPDGNFILAGGTGKKLLMIDINTDTVSILDTTSSYISAMDFSPDLKKIAFTTYYNLIIMEYDDIDKSYVRKAIITADSTKYANSGGLQDVKFSNDGLLLVVSASDYKSRLYSASDYSFIRSYKAPSNDKPSSLIRKSIIFEENKFLLNVGTSSVRIFNNIFGNQLWSYHYDGNSSIKNVSVTDDNIYMIISFFDASLQVWRINSPTTAENNSIKLQLHISPNPASDYINITLPINMFSNPSLKHGVGNVVENVQIFDMLGVEVIHPVSYAATPQDGNLRIDISHLPAGVYYVRIGDKVEKFVKM